MQSSDENLKIIWFEDELLPTWAQMLDVAARICRVAESTRDWFSRFTNSPGTDDSRMVQSEAGILLRAVREQKVALVTELERTRGDGQASRIVAAWEYALTTMIQTAISKKTCSWKVEGTQDTGGSDFGDGDITLRRV
jgi:hypothetical protein